MSRINKFRAWDLDNLEMHYSDSDEDNGEGPIIWRIDANGVYFEENQMWHEIVGGEDEEKWGYRRPNQISMQYVGLKDKNGKEIYEGDIVKGYKCDFVSEVIGVVKYQGMSFCFEGTTSENRYDISGGGTDNYWRYHVTSDIKQLPEIEIIGNKFEHPELLKEIHE